MAIKWYSEKNFRNYWTNRYWADDLFNYFWRFQIISASKSSANTLKKIYGSDFDEDDFYAELPQKADGAYHADAYDEVDEKRKAERDLEIMRDLGYAAEDVNSLKSGAGANEKKEDDEEDNNDPKYNPDSDFDAFPIKLRIMHIPSSFWIDQPFESLLLRLRHLKPRRLITFAR